MPKFALVKIDQVKGKINFYKLKIDGTCEFDEFCLEFKELKGRKKSEKVKDFEIKKDVYRVYLFKDDAGNVIVFGSSKNNQKEDIARLRRLKEEFIKSRRNDNKR